MSFAELREWLEARRKWLKQDAQFRSQLAYISGILGSMSLAKKRPKYSDIWRTETPVAVDVKALKLKMLAWAENANRLNREERRDHAG